LVISRRHQLIVLVSVVNFLRLRSTPLLARVTNNEAGHAFFTASLRSIGYRYFLSVDGPGESGVEKGFVGNNNTHTHIYIYVYWNGPVFRETIEPENPHQFASVKM